MTMIKLVLRGCLSNLYCFNMLCYKYVYYLGLCLHKDTCLLCIKLLLLLLLLLCRQDSSLVAWTTHSPGVPGSSPAAAGVFPWCTHMQ